MQLINDEIREDIIDTARRLAQSKNISRLTVRDILKSMNITNRVFYNRFHNIEEVLEIIYSETINRVRESLSIPWDGESDFGEHIVKVATNTLLLSYATKQNMSQFVFELDSVNQSNYEWWSKEIMQLIAVSKKINYLRADLDDEAVCYSIWCYIRGFNADALARNLKEEEAVYRFQYGFRCLIEGMRRK